MPGKSHKWVLRSAPSAEAISRLGGTSGESGGPLGDLPARLLIGRGITDQAQADAFLNPSYSDLSDPFDMPGMEDAADRVISAIRSGERIGVIGDFDVDGLTATALLLGALKSFGGDAVAYVPDREHDGHGVPRSALSSMHASGVGLVITADTGSGDIEPLQYAVDLGVDVIVTDHHLVGAELPPAVAIVNPHLGDASSAVAMLTGAGVAFKLAQAVGRRMERRGASTAIALAALGTIADVGPLIDENRIIVTEGLKALEATDQAGLKSLMRRAKAGGQYGPIDAEAVAFRIGPRLNAPGRLGHAGISLDLLVCEDPVRADALAGELEALNNERRRLGKEAEAIADYQIGQMEEIPPLISIASPSLHAGLLGPLAGRLVERFNRPVVVAAYDGETVRASLRSTPGFDIFAAMDSHGDLFDRHGGHARAAGFSAPADNYQAIIDALTEAASGSDDIGKPPVLEIDEEVDFGMLGDSLWGFVYRLAPFGEGNPAPLFLTRGVMPEQISAVGASGDHLRMTLDGGGRKFKAIGFGLGGADLGSGLVDVAYVIRDNYWAGRKRRELELKGIRPSV